MRLRRCYDCSRARVFLTYRGYMRHRIREHGWPEMTMRSFGFRPVDGGVR